VVAVLRILNAVTALVNLERILAIVAQIVEAVLQQYVETALANLEKIQATAVLIVVVVMLLAEMALVNLVRIV
jgi:hypothetical protein